MDLSRRSGVITGAGSGIGRQLAFALAERGASLFLVGRRQGALDATAERVAELGGTAHAFTADLTVGSAITEVADAARERLGAIDLLINNAGNVRAGRLEDTDEHDIHAMFNLNLVAPILLTRSLLPDLRKAASERHSLLLGVSSGIALVALPFYTTYAATKSGLAAFDHALRRELFGSGVHVATVYPGATETDMMRSSDAGDSFGFGRRPVADVVEEILAAIERDEHEINTALPNRRLLQELHKTAPLDVDAALAPRLNELEAAVRNHRSI
ncbi:SDR family NAD(P)-dependent oxidoreductase [Leifsonia xyli]|uniref:SDR family NAD(P)-dependent oxidoreductase n=1 Tax=Leifsonia xyli TaxID=1575 RepID=UPI003D6771E1